MKRSLWSSVWIRRALCVTVIFGVVVIMTMHSEKPVVLTANTAVADEGAMPQLGGAGRLAKLTSVEQRVAARKSSAGVGRSQKT